MRNGEAERWQTPQRECQRAYSPIRRWAAIIAGVGSSQGGWWCGARRVLMNEKIAHWPSPSCGGTVPSERKGRTSSDFVRRRGSRGSASQGDDRRFRSRCCGRVCRCRCPRTHLAQALPRNGPSRRELLRARPLALGARRHAVRARAEPGADSPASSMYPFVKLFAVLRDYDVTGHVLYMRHLYLLMMIGVAVAVFLLLRRLVRWELAAAGRHRVRHVHLLGHAAAQLQHHRARLAHARAPRSGLGSCCSGKGRRFALGFRGRLRRRRGRLPVAAVHRPVLRGLPRVRPGSARRRHGGRGRVRAPARPGRTADRAECMARAQRLGARRRAGARPARAW